MNQQVWRWTAWETGWLPTAGTTGCRYAVRPEPQAHDESKLGGRFSGNSKSKRFRSIREGRTEFF